MKCPLGLCNGTGFKPVVDEVGYQSFIPCDCRKERDKKVLLRQKLIEADIPPRLWGYTLDNYLTLPFKPEDKTFNQPSIDILRKYIDDPQLFLKAGSYTTQYDDEVNSNRETKQILWIWGRESNSCHTTLAVILGTALINKGFKVRFIDMQSLLDLFTNFEAKEVETKKLYSNDVLIIDDAFDLTRCVPVTNFKQGSLFSFINGYLNQNKHIICTSNSLIKDIDNGFLQIKTLLLRSNTQLELRGDITSIIRRGR